MKKIISFMLALVMIASMAVVAFADDAAATTPTTETIYDAADFNENVVPTPAAAAGKKGFSDFAFKVDKDLAASADAVCEMWTMSNLKAGNTLKLYYYVAENTGAQVMIYGLDGASFYVIDGSVGYHLAEIVITKDISKIAVYVKNATAEAKSVELYVGSAVVKEGKSFELAKPVTYDAATLSATGATPGTLVDGAVEIAITGGLDRVLNLHDLGYAKGNYNLAIEYDYNGADTAVYFHNGAIDGTFQGIVELLSAGSGTITATSPAGDNGEVYYNLHLPAGAGSTFKVKSISVISTDVANNMEASYDAATLAASSSLPLINDEKGAGLLVSAEYLNNTYAQWTTATAELGTAAGYQITVVYDVLEEGMTGLYLHGYFGFYGMPSEVGRNVYTTNFLPTDNVNYGLLNFHNNGVKKDLVVRAVRVAAVADEQYPGGHPVLEEKYPLELAAEKFANKGTADISAALDAEKAYYVTVNYTNYSTDASATVTVGNKTVNLAPGANKELTFAIAAGANKVVFNSPKAAVLIGDITAIEATADEKAVIGALNAIPGTKTLDKTLATTTATIEAYVKSIIEEKYEGCTDVVVTCAEETFVPFAANKNGSANVTVSLKKDGVELTDTISFNIVSGALSEYDAVVATGDSAIVAIVALIAVISLAGVVIAKKKVASK